ncbi:unnamed protein product [Arctia plantaginis]|uniref:NACHT domain-containing protein n=1 Tax=Arctia plantaginis TaxID=874455 RepID=A0A8S1B3D0_ARCPL|nr:unnamed protein product [Arctia plantaginis]
MDRAVLRRPGTSGISGHLFETKSLALYLFRLQHDPTVQYFRLATNIKGFGAFDDICLVVKIEGHDRPVAIFIQLKHKEDDKAVIKFDNKDKLKYVTSYIKITERIASPQPQEDFLDLNLNETDCFFILYSNAKFNITNTESKFENHFAPVLNSLLATSDAVGCRVQESDQVVEDFGDCFLKNDLVLLSKHFVEFLIDKGNNKSMDIMIDKYVQQYHVILRESVVDVSDIQRVKDTKWRIMTFKREFFTTSDKNVLIFKDQLLKELLQNHRERLSLDSKKSRPSLDETISHFLNAPSAATLTPLIITHIDCNEVGKLEFLIKRPSHDVKLLQQTNMSRKEIDEAISAAETSAMEYLLSLKLKVPVTFGNVDLSIRGSDKKVNSRLEYLTTAISDLCKIYEVQDQYKIVKIDDHLDDGLLKRIGGLAGAVGNMLIYDEITNMMMFSNNFTCEQIIATQLVLNLKNLIGDISQYRFVVKTKRLPKLHFDCTDTAREFLSKLIIYETQSNHWKVEEILKQKIQERLITDSRDSVINSGNTDVSVFLHYHEEILKWWTSPTTYLNEKTNLYEQAILNMKVEPQISALQTNFHISRAKYFKIGFTKNAMKWMELPFKLYITTDTVVLTSVKVVQSLKRYLSIKKLAILDVENVLNLSISDFNSLNEEIKNTEKVLIIMWHKTQNYDESDNNRLSTLALATEDKQSVVITNSELRETINKLFKAQDAFYHETETLSNIESQKEILKHAKALFQGQEVTLDKILDKKSVSFVKGVILDRVIRNKTINIGEPLGNVQYEEVKDFFVPRSVSRRGKTDAYDVFHVNDDDIAISDFNSNVPDERKYFDDYDSVILNETYKAVIRVETFLDIPRDVVLLIAPPGMGKSTLLTHLTLNTKKYHHRLWIVRMDFGDYSKQFKVWYDKHVVIDALEALNLLCQIITRNLTVALNIELTDGKAHLVNEELADFELIMFLHFYNKRKVIFLFDGFDEICPDYKDKVISFLSVVKNDLRKHKMWVASRPYSDIRPDLESVLGKYFKINHLTFTEQESYLRQFWNKKLSSKKSSEEQLKNLRIFLDNTRESISEATDSVRVIYSVFVDTVRLLFFQTPSDPEIDAILNTARTINPSQQVFRLSGIPLLLYFLADYFVNIVFRASNRNKAILEFNHHNIYEMFIKNKLETVIFQNKLNMDLSDQYTKQILKTELSEMISIHKKLAIYPFYQDRIPGKGFVELEDMKPFNEQEWHTARQNIRTGTEKRGLISHVNENNMPVFIHKSFADYFIAEYVCDIIKSSRFKLYQKVLWYCATTKVGDTAIQVWIERKKKSDPTLGNAFLEMEKTSPIYTTKYSLYLNRENITPRQYIRILASSVKDYEDGCFSEFGAKFKMNYFNKIINKTVRRGLTEYFTNCLICKMQPQLKQHFEGTPLFAFQSPDENLVRYFDSDKIFHGIDDILLGLKVKVHKRIVPLFMFLTHQDHCATSQLSNTKSMGENYQKFPTDDTVQTDFIKILLNPGYPRTLHVTSDPSFSSDILNFLSTTSTIGNRLDYTEKNVEELAENTMIKELRWLARVIETSLKPEICITRRKFKSYHVFLSQHVFDVGDIQTDKSRYLCKWRTVTFRKKFFDIEDKYISFLRNCLFERLLSKRMPIFSKIKYLPDLLIPFFLSEPSVATLTLLLGTGVVGCKDNKLEFLMVRPASDVRVEQLRNINMPESTINEAKFAVRTATEIYLRSLHPKATIDFGNIDLPSPRDIEMTSETLKDAIVKLCEQNTRRKVVTIDDSLDESLLWGLASCVGNILIYDEETEMLKVQHLEQLTSAQKYAKSLYLQLSREIDNLHVYRFHVITEKLPRCHLDFKNSARDFLRRLIIFAKDSIDYKIEAVSSENLNIGRRHIKFHDEFVTLNLARLHLHCEVLKWWKTPNTGEYDTKPTDLYQLATENVNLEPIISEMHASFYFKNLKYFKYILSENFTNYIPVDSKTVVITETVMLTTIKVLRSLKSRGFYNEYTVLDLEHMQSTLPNAEDAQILRAELRNTKKTLIMVWRQKNEDVIFRKLTRLLKHKRMVIITNNDFIETVESHRELLDFVFYNEVESLTSIQSHKEIMRDTKVIFQGQNVTLDEIMDDESVTYVKGDVLDKVINNYTLHIGKPLGDPHYNELKDSLIDSRVETVRRADDEFQMSSEDKVNRRFHNIVEDVVFLTDPTGLDKSALFTHLALNTKHHDGKLWIVRVNLPDHVEQFGRWQDEDTTVDDLESLKFLCQVTLNYKLMSFNLALINQEARVVRCVGDAVAAFELNLFVRFYNERRVIFVFDAVDEVGPKCKDKVVTFLSVVSTRLRKSKMWVTSRSHSDILPELERVLGESFTIVSCSD